MQVFSDTVTAVNLNLTFIALNSGMFHELATRLATDKALRNLLLMIKIAVVDKS